MTSLQQHSQQEVTNMEANSWLKRPFPVDRGISDEASSGTFGRHSRHVPD